MSSSKLKDMNNRKEVADFIQSFSRPEGFSTASWFNIKKWAMAVWEAKLASQTWQYTLNISCKEFYAMLCDSNGDCIVADARLLQFENNSYTQKWFLQLLDQATAFAREEAYEEALKTVDLALEIQPKSGEAWNNKAVVLRELKQYKAAFATFSRALVYKKDCAKIWVNRAELFIRVGWFKKALEDAHTAIRLEGTNKHIERLISRALWSDGSHQKAINNWKIALHYYQASEQDWSLLATWQEQTGFIKEALMTYRKALSVNPFHAEALFGKGKLELVLKANAVSAKESLEMAHLLGHQQAKKTLTAF